NVLYLWFHKVVIFLVNFFLRYLSLLWNSLKFEPIKFFLINIMHLLTFLFINLYLCLFKSIILYWLFLCLNPVILTFSSIYESRLLFYLTLLLITLNIVSFKHILSY